jgi:DNA repair photolyase
MQKRTSSSPAGRKNMVDVIVGHRKSNVLVPSALRCLSRIPTINITSGCAHGCIYCYSRGYSQYPGEGRIILFSNTAEKVKDELKRKRKKPAAVYFCPSCDPFQPVAEVLEQTYQTMKILLEYSIGIQFVTKARAPDEFIELFEKHKGLVCGQVGLTTIEDKIRKIFEPEAASVTKRLETVKELLDAGVGLSVRADPLIHGVTDSDEQIQNLCGVVVKNGIKEIAVSYLFLRPAIRKSCEKNIKDKALLQNVLSPYAEGERLSIDARNSQVLALPKKLREKSFKRIRKIALGYGIKIRVCGCKNRDITNESCNIIRSNEKREDLLFE